MKYTVVVETTMPIHLMFEAEDEEMARTRAIEYLKADGESELPDWYDEVEEIEYAEEITYNVTEVHETPHA